MKRVNGVYEQMCSKPLLKQAIINAARHKKKRGQVIQVLKNIDKYVDKLHKMLIEETYKPSPFVEEIIHCPEKDRLIKKSPFFPNRCIHHAIALVMCPKWNKVISNHTFASWKGRGINSSNKVFNINHRVKRAIARVPLRIKLYCFKFDIKKCYENVDNDVLDKVLALHCKDERMLRLMSLINHSDKGLPIGSYLSQLWVNLYLTLLDLFILEILSQYDCYTDYVRYMDDGAIFSDDKEALNKIKHRMENFLYYENPIKEIIQQSHLEAWLPIRGFYYLVRVLIYYTVLAMSTFSSLITKKIVRPFEGQKINIDSIIGKPIDILDYEFCDSKKNDGSKYVKMQINYEGHTRFICTGGKWLIEVLSTMNKSDLPFEGAVILKNRGYYFKGTVDGLDEEDV